MKTLLSRLNLKSWIDQLQSLPPILRSGIMAAAGFVLVTLIYLTIVEPLLNLQEDWTRELSQKEQTLAQYQALLASKDKIAGRLQALQTLLAETNKQMLAGGNAAVAAADLQEVLKNLIKTYGAQSLAIKVMPTKERGPYLEVPIMVQLTGNIDQLFNIIYHLEHNQKLLLITDLDINVPRSEALKEAIPNVRADLVVAGMIKKGAAS